jgi:streptomycin 6-kinase
MSDQFKQNALSRGIDGEKWLASIPSLIAAYEKKWHITAHSPFPLSYNYVARATARDGSSAVLKIGFPKDPEVQSEIMALAHFNGDGCAKLLKSDPRTGVFLVQAIDPGEVLSAMNDDKKATQIIAQTIKCLHKPLPENHQFISVGQWAQSIDRYKKRFPREGPLPVSLVNQAHELFSYLIASSAPEVLTHGDLHHDNILSSSDQGWLAIDPKGIAAEPAYDVAAMIRNPFKKLEKVVDLAPLLSSRIEILSQALAIDPTRLLSWCIAQSVLSATWNIESSKGPQHAVRIAETLTKLRF